VPAARLVGGGPVGDLVPGESGLAQGSFGGQVAVGGDVVLRVREFAPPHPGGHPGAVLDDQRVRTDVVHPGIDHGTQRAGEIVRRLTRRAVDQIEVDVLESGLARLDGSLRGPVRGVLAVEDPQHVRSGRLHAQRDSGEAVPAQRTEIGGVD
jgi:hypothetical protein